MTLDIALSQAATTVPECVAAGYVDVASGMLLSMKTVDSHPRQVIDLLAAATGDLFNGESVSIIERMFTKARGLQEGQYHYFQEIIVNSENLIHIFLRGKTNPDYVAVFVCRKTANLGMALIRARLAMPALEAAF